MDPALQHFIYNQGNLAPVICDQQELGAHTDMIEFQSEKISTFRWTHPGACPMGYGISNQCPFCNRLKTLKPTIIHNTSQTSLACKFCDYSKIYDQPLGWDWIYGPSTKNDT